MNAAIVPGELPLSTPSRRKGISLLRKSRYSDLWSQHVAKPVLKHRFLMEQSLTGGASLDLPAAEAYHALRVLRLRAGDAVEIFDGRGSAAAGRIAETGRDRVTVTLDGPVRRAERLRPAVHLAFAVPKGKRLDWLLEKATELGAASLQPVIFARSVAGGDSLSDAKRARWQWHCVSAAKQCGLNYLPAIAGPLSLSEFAVRREGLCLLGSTADAATLAAAWDGAVEQVWIVIGPEGGLTEKETDLLRGAGFVPVRLGTTTLRTETAAVALLAGVRTLAGRAEP